MPTSARIFFLLLLATAASAQTTVATFNLKELYGASHSEQPVEFPYKGGSRAPASHRMLGPNGIEIPFQQLSSGNLLIRTHLPKSTVNMTFGGLAADPDRDVIPIRRNQSPAQIYPNLLLRFNTTGAPPGGLTNGGTYLVAAFDPNIFNPAVRLKNSLNGPPIDLTSAGTGVVTLVTAGFSADPASDTMISPGHGFRDRDLLRVSSSRLLPDPLAAATDYYIRDATADTFRISSTAGGPAIDLTTIGLGIHNIVVDWTWTLQSGMAPRASAVHPVSVARSASHWEITNGLTGVRVIQAAANPAPYNKAPVQGIRLADGAWAATGPNYLYTEPAGSPGAVISPIETKAYNVSGYSVKLVESGPLKTVIQADYTFNRPRYFYGQQTFSPAGRGYYTARITLYANQQSVLFDEDTDMFMQYFLDLYPGFPNAGKPDIARYQGFYADTPDCGYAEPRPISRASLSGATLTIISPGGHRLEPGRKVKISGIAGIAGLPATSPATVVDRNTFTIPCPQCSGTIGQGGTIKPVYTGGGGANSAYFDLNYQTGMAASYICTPSAIKKLSSWQPVSYDTGWWWLQYNAGAGPAAPLLGIFTGKTSQMIASATGPSTPGFYTSNHHFTTGTVSGGIQVAALRSGPDAALAPRTKRNWGLFVGTKADLATGPAQQKIAIECNTLSGINLTSLYRYDLTFADPPGGWKWQYMPTAAIEAKKAKVRNGRTACGSETCYYDLLAAAGSDPSGSFPAILDLWRDDSPAAVASAMNIALIATNNLANVLANQDGIRDGFYQYSQGGFTLSKLGTLMNAVLMDSNATPAQKSQAKAFLALWGNIFWDNDFVPIENYTGDTYGTPNQIVQYLQYRAQFAIQLSSHPLLSTKVEAAKKSVLANYALTTNSYGSFPASTWYQSGYFQPTLSNFMNMSVNGQISFADFPNWAKNVDAELANLTPPEPRFGNLRKNKSDGDGNTAAHSRLGMAATALRQSNPSKAEQAIWGWASQNSNRSASYESLLVPMLVAIDDTIPRADPRLTSSTFPHYQSTHRHAWGTPNETALWFLNGDFYFDHRHADAGQLSIYAHSAPLSVDWNANLYYPRTEGAYMHNGIVTDATLAAAGVRTWNADSPPLNAGASWGAGIQKEFSAFSQCTQSIAAFTAAGGSVWTRTVKSCAANPRYPILFISDSFSGSTASAPKTLTWNLMAAGPVATPAGVVNPVAGRFDRGGQLPSAGPVESLPPGLQRFTFGGASWPKHATGGIDWDLYSESNVPGQQFFIGNWGHNAHSSREASEFAEANGRNFDEIQHILRIHGTGPFQTYILPYRKTETPQRKIAAAPCGLQILQGNETSCLSTAEFTYTDGASQNLTAFDDASHSAYSMTVSGGPQEVVRTGSTITWTVGSITPGMRSLTLPPGSWTPDKPVTRAGATFQLNHPGGPQPTPITIIFTSSPVR